MSKKLIKNVEDIKSIINETYNEVLNTLAHKTTNRKNFALSHIELHIRMRNELMTNRKMVERSEYLIYCFSDIDNILNSELEKLLYDAVIEGFTFELSVTRVLIEKMFKLN